MVAEAERNRGEDQPAARGGRRPQRAGHRRLPGRAAARASWATRRRRTRGPAPRCSSPTPAQAVKEEAPLDRRPVADRRTAAGLPRPGAPAAAAGPGVGPAGARRRPAGAARRAAAPATTTSSTPSSRRAEATACSRDRPATDAAGRAAVEPPTPRRTGARRSSTAPTTPPDARRAARRGSQELRGPLAPGAGRPGQPAQARTPGSWPASGPTSGPGSAAAWLPVVDNLELRARARRGRPGAIVEGVRAVRDQAVAVLARLGFPRHDETGVPFDPARHEAVGVVPDTDAPAGTVVAGAAPRLRRRRPAAAPGGRRGRRRAGSEPAWHATTTRCSACRGRASAEEIQQAYRKLARTLPPRRQQGPGRRGAVQGDQRGVPRAVRPGDRARATTAFGAGLPAGPRGRRRRDVAGAGARPRRPAVRRRGRPPRRGGQRRRCELRRRRTSTSRTCSAGCSAAAGAARLGTDPRRRPGGRARR